MRFAAVLLPLLLPSCASPGAEVEPRARAAPGEPASPSTSEADAGLVFTAPEGWVAEPPAGSMRVAQYRLPGNDGSNASLVVYHFGGGGGSVEANVERWCSQFEQPDGRDSRELLQQVARSVGGHPIHEVYLSGTYVAETAPGSGERVNHPDWRLMAAVIQSDIGPYYVKLVGPESIVRRWELSFRTFLNSIR